MDNRTGYPDNPVNAISLAVDGRTVLSRGDDFDAMTDNGDRFQVLDTTVGRHGPASIVSAKDLGPGAQIQWLLDSKAIRQLSEAEIAIVNEGGTLPAPFVEIGGNLIPVTANMQYGPLQGPNTWNLGGNGPPPLAIAAAMKTPARP